jgi:LuxR family maltose regulon positive regulatory protein
VDPAPLAEAKLAVPRQRAEMVQRPRLSRRLDAGREAALTLVAAPLGYGKTTAVRAWCATRPEEPLVWVTLDAADNDPVRLWRYVATAVDRVRDGLGRAALRRLAVSGTSVEDPVDDLMNGIAAFGQELVLVLDDLHAVTDAECLASIEYAIERLPGPARLVAISRVDPTLRLGRLRALGVLDEVRADELAFTVAEVHELPSSADDSTWARRRRRCCTRGSRVGRPPSCWRPSGFVPSTSPAARFASSEASTASWRTTSATR